MIVYSNTMNNLDIEFISKAVDGVEKSELRDQNLIFGYGKKDIWLRIINEYICYVFFYKWLSSGDLPCPALLSYILFHRLTMEQDCG